MSIDEERLSKATAAGKRASSSPYEKQAKSSAGTSIWRLGTFVFQVVVAVWLARHGAPWWMVWGWWAMLAVSWALALVFGPFASKLKRRKMLLAREQVHRVRQLDAADPVGLGLGHLFDADPGLDRLSVEAGVRFALARVNAVLDEVDAATPEPSLFGYTIDSDGKATKK
jgi:hypothetical protein